MNFENHWDYPGRWPSRLYDPVLKVMVRPNRGPSGHEYLAFAIFYDPEIKPGQYEMPIPPKYRNPYSIATVWEFESERSKEVGNFSAHGKVAGTTLRIKFMDKFVVGTHLDPLVSLRRDLDWMRRQEFPIISEFPESFLLYVLKNYIYLRSIRERDFTKERYPDLKRIEMCVQRPNMTQSFGLNLADYAEVEPNWFCIASRELDQ